jgi:hypothetical protein
MEKAEGEEERMRKGREREQKRGEQGVTVESR